jgi:hypothetical protein
MRVTRADIDADQLMAKRDRNPRSMMRAAAGHGRSGLT